MKFGFLSAATIGCFMVASASAALATPIGTVETFSTSVGYNASNLGTIKLTQISSTSVQIFVDLAPGFGFLNTGGPHTPFAFNLGVSSVGLSISSWTTPSGGVAPKGTFVLNTGGGQATPFGTYNTALDYTIAGNGTSNAYIGDLSFVLSRTGGLDLVDFTEVSYGASATLGLPAGKAFFAADITSGVNAPAGTTGSQAWDAHTTTTPVTTTDIPVPEPLTLSLFSVGLLGAAALRRKKARKA